MHRTEFNAAIIDELARIAEVAGFLWTRDWAERNGGNISVNLTLLAGEDAHEFPSNGAPIPLDTAVPELAGNIIYLTGAGRRMRDVARSPLACGPVIRITAGGGYFEILTGTNIPPSSELPSHLAMQRHFRISGSGNRAVLHTHPTELIALSHCKPFMNAVHLTRTLWSMIPESRIIVPRGIGIVPYLLTGTAGLAMATMALLEDHDVILWEKHGVLAVGEDITECFDRIDTLTKSARIYLLARTAGYEPQGLTGEQLEELAQAFRLPSYPAEPNTGNH